MPCHQAAPSHPTLRAPPSSTPIPILLQKVKEVIKLAIYKLDDVIILLLLLLLLPILPRFVLKFFEFFSIHREIASRHSNQRPGNRIFQIFRTMCFEYDFPKGSDSERDAHFPIRQSVSCLCFRMHSY